MVDNPVTAWKQHELRVAKKLGGTRAGPNGKHGSDISGTPFAVECKRTTRYSLRRAWVDQARRQSKQEGKPWLLVVSEHGDRSPIVVMEFAALLELLNVAEEEGDVTVSMPRDDGTLVYPADFPR